MFGGHCGVAVLLLLLWTLTYEPSDCAKFLDQTGILKPSDMRASQVVFDRKSEHMGEWEEKWVCACG